MSDRYTNSAQQRILQLLLRLAGHEIEGIAPSELAAALHTGPSNVTRDLANLRTAGLAEEIAPNRWRLSPRVAQISLAVQRALARAQDKVDETRQRFTREL